MSDNKSIKFPAKHYVGFQARPSRDELPLGFMTPHGTDKAFEKRKDTVDRWAGGWGYDAQNKAEDKLPAQTYENKPMTGFKLGRNVRHGYGWGQGNVKWRIEDPRGFELEISSPNLAQIMGFCTVQEGEILEDCIWARMGAENILVPVNSDVYRATVRNTERASKSASLRDLNIGDTAILANGDEGIYYGVYYIYGVERYARTLTNTVQCSGKKRHVFLMQTPGEDGVSSRRFMRGVSSPKLAEVFEGEKVLTHQEAEAIVNGFIQEGIALNEAGQNYSDSIAVSIDQLDDNTWTRTQETTNYDELVQKLKDQNPEYEDNLPYLLRYKVGGKVFAVVDGQPVLVPVDTWESTYERAPGRSGHYGNLTQQHWTFPMIKLDPVRYAAGDFITIIKTVPNPNHSPYWGSPRHTTVQETLDIDTSKDDLPDTLIMFKMVNKTTAGCEVSYYL